MEYFAVFNMLQKQYKRGRTDSIVYLCRFVNKTIKSVFKSEIVVSSFK